MKNTIPPSQRRNPNICENKLFLLKYKEKDENR